MTFTPSALQQTPPAIIYPDSDGQPMADNTQQFGWISKLKAGCEALFKDDPNVFVAGDFLWYPIEGDNVTRRAPDVMVVFGRQKGDRGSYKQWEEDNIPPQVVFEVLSPGNRLTEMALKLQFYDRHGVEEYYLYDPDSNELTGWQRNAATFEVIEPINGWVSPRLGVRFELTDQTLEVIRPDGQRFLSYLELEEQRDQLAQQRDRLAAKLKELGIDPAQL
jgi:Uma2 family endonuclease